MLDRRELKLLGLMLLLVLIGWIVFMCLPIGPARYYVDDQGYPHGTGR